jgi:Serine carboxypeptidase S28
MRCTSHIPFRNWVGSLLPAAILLSRTTHHSIHAGESPAEPDFPPVFTFDSVSTPVWHPAVATQASMNTTASFQLHYSYNTDAFQEDGTLFFVPGGQSALDEEALRRVYFLWDQGTRMHSALLVAEQRFYGQSQPFPAGGVWTWEQLAALETDAVLLDYTHLIRHFKREVLADAEVGLVVAAGVGYSGLVADWLATYSSTGNDTEGQMPLVDG